MSFFDGGVPIVERDTGVKSPIILRLTLENMEWQIVQALYPHEVELKEQVNQAVRKTIQAFDFEGEIRRQVNILLNNRIHRKIENAIIEAFNKQSDFTLDRLIANEVEKQLRKK